MKEFIIKENEANQRFDKYLKKLLPNASSGFIYKMLRKKNITLGKKKATGTETLKKGDVVQLFFSDETFDKFAVSIEEISKLYENLKNTSLKGIEIIFEDDDILIANKPYNMLSQKASESDLSANERLLGYLIQTNQLSLETFQTFHPSVCNRLDRNTTGILLMGKTLKGTQMLSEQLKDRSAQKYYLAIVNGCVDKEADLEGYLYKDESNNIVKILKEEIPNSNYIHTSYRPIKTSSDLSLIEIHLHTGKTHQIRAHLSSIGHPIIGDYKYGIKEVNDKYYKEYHITHQLLHAYRIILSDQEEYIVNPPKEFDNIMK